MNDRFKKKAAISLLVNKGYEVVDIVCYKNPHYEHLLYTMKLKYQDTFLYTRASDIYDFTEQFDVFCTEIDRIINEANEIVFDKKNYFDFIAGQIIEKYIIDKNSDVYFVYSLLEDAAIKIFRKCTDICSVLEEINNADFSWTIQESS